MIGLLHAFLKLYRTALDQTLLDFVLIRNILSTWFVLEVLNYVCVILRTPNLLSKNHRTHFIKNLYLFCFRFALEYELWLFVIVVFKATDVVVFFTSLCQSLCIVHICMYIFIIHYMSCIGYCILCIMLYSTYMRWAYVCTYVLYTTCHALCIVSYVLC